MSHTPSLIIAAVILLSATFAQAMPPPLDVEVKPEEEGIALRTVYLDPPLAGARIITLRTDAERVGTIRLDHNSGPLAQLGDRDLVAGRPDSEIEVTLVETPAPDPGWKLYRIRGVADNRLWLASHDIGIHRLILRDERDQIMRVVTLEPLRPQPAEADQAEQPEPAGQINLTTMPLEPRIGPARQITITGELGGKGILQPDPNITSRNEVGSPSGMTSLMAYDTPEVTIEPIDAPNLPEGASLYNVKGYEHANLQLASLPGGIWRLLVLDGDGRVARVVTLEPPLPRVRPQPGGPLRL